MDSVFEEMQKEDMRDKFWNLVKGWGDKKIVNYLVDNVSYGIVADVVGKIENLPEDELTPREAFNVGMKRAELRQRLDKITGEELLNMNKERLVKEMALQMQIPALEEFVSYLENSGDEICKTWRPKLVSIGAGKHNDKVVVFGYFKTDINEEELEACHKAYLLQNNWDYETNIPEGYSWKLDRNLEEASDAVAKGAGWTRYVVGTIE